MQCIYGQYKEHLEVLNEASRHLPEGTVLLGLYSTSSYKVVECSDWCNQIIHKWSYIF
jgi:hypothetical protein